MDQVLWRLQLNGEFGGLESTSNFWNQLGPVGPQNVGFNWVYHYHSWGLVHSYNML
jgi:hypothetical protein